MNSNRTLHWFNGNPAYIWTAWLWIAWSVWWGGISFYALVVVPIGTDLVGSTAQGFITQQVTRWHNLLLVGLVLCLAVEACVRPNRLLVATVGLLALISVGLLYWHSKLTGQMDFQQQTVPSSFYAQHAIYLWLTTLEWLVGLAVPLCLRKDWDTGKN